MVLSGTGWTPSFQNTLDYAGKLAASVSNFFSGTTKAESDAQNALREQQRQAIASIETEQIRQETAKVTGFLDWQRAKTFIAQWWWLALIIAFLIFQKPILRFFNIYTGKQRTGTRRKVTRSKTVTTPKKTKTVKSNPGNPKSRTRSNPGSKTFRRKLKGKIYTDPKAWSRAMRRLRG